jgi:hypothetical protein
MLLERVPDYPLSWLGIAANELALGNAEDAFQAASHARFQWGDHPSVMGTLGMAAARSGRTDEARACLSRLEMSAEIHYVNSFEFALVYLGLGETEAALLRLELSFQQRGGYAVFARVHPLLDPLRAHPSFQALVEQLGYTVR